jgi:diphosphomevalonate decarboxylase
MNLAALTTATTVEFREGLPSDSVTIDDKTATEQAEARVVAHLDRVRALAGTKKRARVASRNDFPAGTGLASSAAAFAALSLAAARAAGLDLEERDLSRLARLGSGSACRSVPGGFSLWEGDSDEESYARQVAAADHWDLRDVIAIVSRAHKKVGSLEGHSLAPSSPLHKARLAAIPRYLEGARLGIEKRDLSILGTAVEVDTLAMHGVMMTSEPSLLYWLPETVAVLREVSTWRQGGLGVYFTMDAGPNVHCLCEAADSREVESRLRNLHVVQDVIVSGPGEAVRPVNYSLF